MVGTAGSGGGRLQRPEGLREHLFHLGGEVVVVRRQRGMDLATADTSLQCLQCGSEPHRKEDSCYQHLDIGEAALVRPVGRGRAHSMVTRPVTAATRTRR